VLVTDVGLPGMNGAELANAIQALHPGARTLFISGYAEDGEFRDRLQQGAHGFLQKPFRPAELVDRIVQLMVQPPAASAVLENP
jgi:DNA-binding NarL/FixJ family response regulator